MTQDRLKTIHPPDLSASAEPELRLDGDIVLRPLTEADVTDRYVDGLNNPQVNRFLLAGRGRQSVSEVRAWVRSNWCASDALVFGIFAAGEHCGNVRVHDVTAERAYMGIAIFDLQSHGRGIGTAAIAAVSHYVVSELRVGEILAGIDDDNDASQRAFARAGFKRVSGNTRDRSSFWRFRADDAR
jgi:[ribosomal protein S5]-alanine N-acetyltransferase